MRTGGGMEFADLLLPAALGRAAATLGLPGLYWSRDYVEDGGLMSYSADLVELRRRVAAHVDTILKGAKPADLPTWLAKQDRVMSLRQAPPACGRSTRDGSSRSARRSAHRRGRWATGRPCTRRRGCSPPSPAAASRTEPDPRGHLARSARPRRRTHDTGARCRRGTRRCTPFR